MPAESPVAQSTRLAIATADLTSARDDTLARLLGRCSPFRQELEVGESEVESQVLSSEGELEMAPASRVQYAAAPRKLRSFGLPDPRDFSRRGRRGPPTRRPARAN